MSNQKAVEQNPSLAIRMYKVIFKDTYMGCQFVFAQSVELQGDYLLFFNAAGTLTALFLRRIVASWSFTDAETA